MTGKAVDYSIKPVSFYKFVCNDPEIKSIYVGHTINFIERKAHHKKVCNGENYKGHHLKIYQIIRENKGFENWRMIEIEKRIVKDKREAEQIETEYMKQLQSDMNINKAHCGFETKQEYMKERYQEHRDEFSLKNKEYRQEHRDEISLKKKEYYQEHQDEINLKAKDYHQEHRDEISLKRKEKITCECGSISRKGDLAQHKKSQKHKSLMETKVEKVENITLTIKEDVEEEVEEEVEEVEAEEVGKVETREISFRIWDKRMTYLCVDIRNYHGRPQM